MGTPLSREVPPTCLEQVSDGKIIPEDVLVFKTYVLAVPILRLREIPLLAGLLLSDAGSVMAMTGADNAFNF
jgi:hypothetical protein